MSEIRFVDTTLRDGHLSLWALRMRIGHMLGAARQMDRCGFESMEFFGFASIIKQVRELKENPWDWVRLGVKQFSRTRLRYHGGIGSGFEPIPPCIRRLLLECVIAHGITLTRSSNPWNDYDVLARELEFLGNRGMEVVGNIIYSVSPKHTNEYYERKTRELAALRPYRVCFKDVGGLLTPDRTREMLQLVMANVGDIPVEFHAHCNNSLAPFNYVEALKLGVKTLHTAIPPLANGSSQPSIFNVAANAEALGITPHGGPGGGQARGGALHPRRPAGKLSHRRTQGIRLRPILAPGARRHDLQPALPARNRGHGATGWRRPWRRPAACARSTAIPSW